MESTEAGIDRGVTVRTAGPVPAAAVADLVYGVSRVLHTINGVAIAHLRITRHRSGPEVTVFQINASIDGWPCRAQLVGDGAWGASGAVERFDRQLDQLLTPARYLPRQYAAARNLAAITEVRPITRRKMFPTQTLLPAAASEIMDTMDYDAHLFRDRETGEDAIVYRAGTAGVRLLRQTRVELPAARDNLIAVDLTPTHALPDIVAAKRLCRNGLPFLFYVDPATTRGKLLYRRYDGDLALITATPTR
ncbi:sigma 54 modulation/S30EA ribosomal C-terminal domain-containing protein [Nocardia rhizosphaerae]|uniref:Sigma 54 modulation/S30EA ribosomal C-terminal domain-containing protein n=1 Tax=Nocardia rhizosphaerae TaxID=1691571 RepID=A0ABV8L428_9NOCA